MKSLRFLLGLVWVSLFVVALSPAYAVTPRFEIVVSEVAGEVVFEFFREEGWWPFKRKVASEVFELSVHLPGGTSQLWEIESSAPHAGRVTYGRLPPGFTQRIPLKGPPPPLKAGLTYNVSARGPGVASAVFICGGC